MTTIEALEGSLKKWSNEDGSPISFRLRKDFYAWWEDIGKRRCSLCDVFWTDVWEDCSIVNICPIHDNNFDCCKEYDKVGNCYWLNSKLKTINSSCEKMYKRIFNALEKEKKND